jgi:release factor glutamine methyltransferase
LLRTVQDALTLDSARLAKMLALDSSSARIEIQCLLQQVLHVSRAYLLGHPDCFLQDSEQLRYNELLRRRLAGEPIAYILGEREFFGLKFKVTPATLIPRPETELLVDLALARIPPHETCRVLDLGAGSGALALSIAHARADVDVTAVDASQDALEVARENALHLKIGNVRLLSSDWFSSLAGEHFDLIVSNPPYIAATDAHLEQGDLRFEPRTALASGTDGLGDIRRIVAGAQSHLNPGGWLLLEHGYDQAVTVREILREAGFGEVFSARDLAGIERASGGRN